MIKNIVVNIICMFVGQLSLGNSQIHTDNQNKAGEWLKVPFLSLPETGLQRPAALSTFKATQMSKNLNFLELEFKTPNTYSPENHMDVPNASGVYMLVWIDLELITKDEEQKREILYIGSAKNLLQRYCGHEVLRVLRKTHGYIQFHFKVCGDYYEQEIELIKKFSPIFNTQHNG